MMLQSWVAMLLVMAISALVGRAVTRLAGSEKWTGLEPAAGLGAVLAIEGFTARTPGGHTIVVVALLAMVAASAVIVFRGHRPGRPALCMGLVATLVITFLVINVPFAVSGRWGILGVGYNNDLGLHLAWADWIKYGIGTVPDAGYPLGAHGFTASLAALPGLKVPAVFIGQIMAMVMITAWTAWSAVETLPGWRRTLAACLIAAPYLLASYYAQAAFKELLTALFLLAFAIWLGRMFLDRDASRNREPGRRILVLPAALFAGIIFTYSFPGLMWPLAVLFAVLLTEPRFRARLSPSSVWHTLRRPAVAAGIAGLGVLVLVLAFAGQFGFAHYFAKVSVGTAFGPVSPAEGLGVWLNPDYRLAGRSHTPMPIVMLAISGTALLVALWWWRRRWPSVWPIAFFTCVAIYVLSLPWVGDYSLAKALTISSPITMVVILTALLSGPAGGWKPSQGMEFGAWVTLATLFIGGAIASSMMALRDASVAPPGHGAQLEAFRDEVKGHPVLYLDEDRFAPVYLSGIHVGAALNKFPDPEVIVNPDKPLRTKKGQSPIDFDSFAPETYSNFDFAITTSAAWQSGPPPFFTPVDRTSDYILWKRTGVPKGRRILDEAKMPAMHVMCAPGAKPEVPEGNATVLPESVAVMRSRWWPDDAVGGGQRVRITARPGPGKWLVSLQYFSPFGFQLTAPGYRRDFIPALSGQHLSNFTGGQGQYWPGGTITVKKRGPVKFTVTTPQPSLLQRLTGYSIKTQLGVLVLTRAGSPREIPLKKTCGQWVDFYEPGA